MDSSLGTRHLAILATALTLVCSVRAANSAVEEPEPEADVMEMSLEELLDLDVTTASKKKETLTAAPALTHVITRDQILRYGYRNVGEALSSVLGFYPTTDLAYDYTGVRGFGRSGDSNTRLLVLFDGQRVNDPLYGFGAVDESLSIDIDGVERIEVVKGPGSALWGSNALLAVVNIVPQTGGDIDGVDVGGEYGTHNRMKGYTKAGKKFDNGLEIAGLFSLFDDDGDSNIDIPGIGPSGTSANAGNHDDESAGRGYLTASYHGFKFNAFAGSREREDPTGANFVIFNSPFDTTEYKDDRLYTQLSYEHELLPEWNGRLFARVYHSLYNHHADYEFDSRALFPDVDPYINADSGKTQWWGSELQFSFKPHDRVDLVGGLEYHDIYKAEFKNIDQFSLHLDEDLDWQIMAGYVQGEFEIFEFLRIVLGGRVDDYSDLKAEWSPRVAVVVTPFEGTVLKALYGQAFRAPNAYERVYDNGGLLGRVVSCRRGCAGSQRLAILGNEDLEPETITTWEAIWDQALFGNTRMVVSLYQYEIDDIIAPIYAGPAALQYQNLGEVRSRGVEVMVQTRLKNGIWGHVGFSALRAEDRETGRRIENSPRYLGNLGVSVPLFSEHLFASSELQVVSGRETIDGDELSTSYNTNLVLIYKPVKWANATFGIYNLFDEDQTVPSALEHTNNGTDYLPLRGRVFRGVIRTHF
jgi:iron complex outermembrane receptor protein